MRIHSLGLLMVAIFAVCSVTALGQATGEDLRTSVAPLPGEEILNPCEYRMAPPDTGTSIKASWIIFDRGQDYLKWFEDRQIRAFARGHHLALVLAMQCRSREREDMIVIPQKGVGPALFRALDQFADTAGRPELKTAGIIAMGWSGAGSLVGRLAGFRPERYLAGIAYAPGQYEPLGMDTIELSNQAIRSPQLIIANGADNINGTERPYGYFKKYFDRGAPWTFAVQNRTPHCCLQNAGPLILDWLHAVLTTDARHRGTGAYGFLRVQTSEIRDEWKRPVFDAISSRIGSNGKGRSGELPAGWMPSTVFGQEWLTLTGRSGPIAVWRP